MRQATSLQWAGFSHCGAWASLSCGMWDPSSLTKVQISIPCFARSILHHWATREAPGFCFLSVWRPLGISVQSSRCSQLLTVGIISPVFRTRPQAERGDVCGSEPRWQSWQSQPPAAGGWSRGLWGAGKDPRVGWVLADTADAK